jgi:glucan endo-1,3-alpha-glucosidase
LTLPLDITLAASKGLDGFVLNVGRDSWQPAKVADAFTAAQNFGPDFKLFLSFDMTSFPCSSASDVTTLRDYIYKYRFHSNSLLYNGRVVVSTFAGEYCFFGTSSLNDGWRSVVKKDFQTYFIPSFFVDPSEFSTLDFIDGAFNVTC